MFRGSLDLRQYSKIPGHIDTTMAVSRSQTNFVFVNYAARSSRTIRPFVQGTAIHSHTYIDRFTYELTLSTEPANTFTQWA
jgi:hypothetical protein